MTTLSYESDAGDAACLNLPRCLKSRRSEEVSRQIQIARNRKAIRLPRLQAGAEVIVADGNRWHRCTS